MFFKNFQAYLCIIVVSMVILELLPVEDIWNLSIFIKVLIKSHSCFLVLKISFILKNFLFQIIFKKLFFILYICMI